MVMILCRLIYVNFRVILAKKESLKGNLHITHSVHFLFIHPMPIFGLHYLLICTSYNKKITGLYTQNMV
uniref:Uncharacterized protein n=1 Tax=Lepeophtheirus salmonis TaxID=72036 RepID=A0A0K2V7B0_LEPSM